MGSQRFPEPEIRSMRGRTPSEGRFVGTGSAHAALTIGSRALGASEPRQVRKEAALRTPSQVPRYRPIRVSDADTSGDADLEGGARGRAFVLQIDERGRSWPEISEQRWIDPGRALDCAVCSR